MTRLVAGRRAGRAIGERNRVSGGHHQRLTVQARKADVQDVRLAAGRIAVDLMFDRLQVVQQLLAGLERGGSTSLPFQAGQPRGLAQTDGQRDRDRAGPQATRTVEKREVKRNCVEVI